MRKRHLEPLIRKMLKHSPVTGILGHRQVGKTTLASLIGNDYYTLDIRSTQDLVQGDPLGFLNSLSKPPSVLDECQLVPDLFPAIKEFVREHKKPGSLLLTGSVRFTSRKAIRESLTGRIVSFDLLPLDYSEIHNKALPDSIIKIAKNMNSVEGLSVPSLSQQKQVDSYLENGGLPGLFAVRDSGVRKKKFDAQLETILERDLRLLLNTTLSFSSLRNFLQYLAMHQGESIKFTEVARATQITRPTIQKLVSVFESLFLIRSVPSEGGTAAKVYYLEDQGEATQLIGARRDPLFDLTRFLYANLRVQFHYRPELQGEIFSFHKRSGIEVPLCFRVFGRQLGVIPILERNPNKRATASALSFLKFYPKSSVVFVTVGDEIKKITPRTCVVPAISLLS